MTILRMPQVQAKTGLSKSRIYRLEREGRFPARIELGPNSVGWVEAEVDEWIAGGGPWEALNGDAPKLEAGDERVLDPYSLPVLLRPYRPYVRRRSGELGYLYFLMKGRSVVYVGQTSSLEARLASHRSDGKDFTEVLWMHWPLADIARAERWFINKFNPPLNLHGTRGRRLRMVAG